MRRPLVLVFLFCVSPANRLRESQAADTAFMTPDRQREVLRQALSAFDDAVACAQHDPAGAQELYRRAAGSFESLVTSGMHSAALEYNLGNTYFRLGMPGHAILHYRRAERLAPGDEVLRANLAYARRQAEPHFPARGQERLWQRLLFWHYGSSLAQRFRTAAVLSGLGWMLLMIRLRWRTPMVLAAGAFAIVLALACGGSVLAQLSDERARPPAVVVEGGYLLRLGRGEGYDPALRQSLGAGVEVRILQQRGDWVEVRLPNDLTGWLPAAAIERL